MAKRRKNLAAKRAAKKAAKLTGMKPKGKSRYAKRQAARHRGVVAKGRLAFCPGCFAKLSRQQCRCGMNWERNRAQIEGAWNAAHAQAA